MTSLFDLPFDEPDAQPTVPQPRRVFSVTELTTAIRGLLEDAFVEVWVEGELSNCRVWNTGHLYFTLKDGGAQLRAVMFRSALRLMKFRPEDGTSVLARGRISVYEPKGEYQLVCEHMEPRGPGALQLAFEQLKKRLQAEGLFDAARKRPLPALPRKIGVVSSLDGAALRDIIKVLHRRYPNAHLVVRPARVQGEGAASDIARALGQIALVGGVDVVIVGRGGGSVEDLWAFNEETVARAIADCTVPVISAVGHEVDFTIADFVADLRAPTPSAAAEMVVARKDEYVGHVDLLRRRVIAALRHMISGRKAQVHVLVTRRGFAGLPARLAMRGRHAAELVHELRRTAGASLITRERRCRMLRLKLESHDPGRRMALFRARLAAADGRLTGAASRAHHAADLRARTLSGRLDNLSPLAVLARGYAVCWNDDRTQVVRNTTAVTRGSRVRVTLHAGELRCRVEEVL